MTEKIQKAIKVCSEATLKDLNDHLEMGWKVVSMCGMPSSVSTSGNRVYSTQNAPTCLVIIEGEVSE